MAETNREHVRIGINSSISQEFMLRWDAGLVVTSGRFTVFCIRLLALAALRLLTGLAGRPRDSLINALRNFGLTRLLGPSELPPVLEDVVLQDGSLRIRIRTNSDHRALWLFSERLILAKLTREHDLAVFDMPASATPENLILICRRDRGWILTLCPTFANANQTYANWRSRYERHGATSTADGPTLAVIILPSSTNIEASRTSLTAQTDSHWRSYEWNEGLPAIEEPWTLFLRAGDRLAPHAVATVRSYLAHASADVVYFDDDIVGDEQTRSSPLFKPVFDKEMLRSFNFIGNAFWIRTSLLPQFAQGDNLVSWIHEVLLRALESHAQWVHLPHILYHNALSTLKNQQELFERYSAEMPAVVGRHLERSNVAAQTTHGLFPGSVRIDYTLTHMPLVSIVIPNSDHADDLERCLSSLVDKTSYSNFEILIGENGSQRDETFRLYQKLQRDHRIRVLDWTLPFNYAAINNWLVAKSSGDYVLLLNNDVEILHEDWLTHLLGYAQQPGVGAVGAKLLYADGRIQHAGVVVGLGGIAGHPFRGLPDQGLGYGGRLKLPQSLSAVTAACLLMPRTVFDTLGGFDTGFEIAFNDVDLCMRVRERNLAVLWTPHARLIHHESRSRGPEDTPAKVARFRREIDRFAQRWGFGRTLQDPFYSPHLALTGSGYTVEFNGSIQERLGQWPIRKTL